jgi:UDP-N-acetylmuramoyl-L-alanyl-D-glutamate--2,6-diaminopimelate ligase
MMKRLGQLLAGLNAHPVFPLTPIDQEGALDARDSDPLISEITLDLNEVHSGVLFIARRLWYIDTHSQVHDALARGASAVLVSRPKEEWGTQSTEVSARITTSPQREKLEPLSIEWNAHSTGEVWLIEDEDPTLGVISDRFYDHPTRQLKVYGVTGTNGKTSTISFLYELLTALDERVATMGTVEYRFEHHRLKAPNTTPDALVIHRFARRALDLGATALALEVSSHALTLHRVAAVCFDAVGFTSFGRDHLDFHGTLEGYREAKATLFDAYLRLSLSSGKRPGGVAHGDSDGQKMLDRCPEESTRIRCHVTPVEDPPRSDGALDLYLLSSAPPSLEGLQLNLSTHASASVSLSTLTPALASETEVVQVPLIGDYHQANLAIALGMAGLTHGQESLVKAWTVMKRTNGVPGRMERVWYEERGQGSAERAPNVSTRERVALVDYAHTPDAITRALEALRLVHSGHITTLIGCGGDRDRGKRPLMLQAALSLSDHVIITSDNPRSEPPSAIIDEILTGLDEAEDPQTVSVEVDRRRAIDIAWRALPARGALLITGKGHEDSQEIAARKYTLSDPEALRASVYAERMGVEIEQVPFSLTLPPAFDRSSPSPSAGIDVLSEASSRTGGLMVMIWADPLELLDPLNTLTVDPVHENPHERPLSSITPQEVLIIDFESVERESHNEKLLFESLLDQIEDTLCPRHRLLLIRCTNEGVQALLSKRLTQLIPSRSPHVLSRVGRLDLGSEELYIRGGWLTAASSPYIPNLPKVTP